MHRPEARTVSLTVVEVGPERARMIYYPIPPTGRGSHRRGPGAASVNRPERVRGTHRNPGFFQFAPPQD